MNQTAKLLAFAAALTALFGAAALAGAVIDPDRDDDLASAEPQELSDMTDAADHEANKAAHPIRGLAVAEAGLRVIVDDPELRCGRPEWLRFRVVDDHGATVRDLDVEHEKRMHLILARRDLTGFQHLHPEQAPDGSWRTSVRVDEAGSYRLFADFSHEAESRTLAADLRVDGAGDLRPLPAPQPNALSDGGYEVRLDAARARPGVEAELTFAITNNGEPVRTEPYLGAGGHLVALREGDMAFLHVHPVADDPVRFGATFPTEGRYRLFLQFKHDGRVHTVAFTQEVG
jgi:hypothetical protein